jgi:serine/threonine protein phosphatase PrpC
MNRHKASPQEQTLHLHVAAQSETGHQLERNADAFAFYDLSDPQQTERLGRLYVLADGTGDDDGGEIASRIAVETIPAVYYEPGADDSPLIRLQRAFFAAHCCIHEFATLHREYDTIATSCTAVVVRGTHAWIAHIGDSRAYLVRTSPSSQPSIIRLTTDHSLTARMVRAGELPPEQLRYAPDRDIFLRALGKSEEDNPYPDFAMPVVYAGDTLVLCSDGLWSAVTEEQIAHFIDTMPPQQACEALVRLANDAGGDENISIIILSFSQGEKGRRAS